MEYWFWVDWLLKNICDLEDIAQSTRLYATYVNLQLQYWFWADWPLKNFCDLEDISQSTRL